MQYVCVYIYIAWGKTNGFLDKTLSGGQAMRDEKYKQSILNLKKKNLNFMMLIKVVTLPIACAFFLPPLIPAFLRSIDYTLMIFSIVSGAALLSGLRYFK